MSATVGLTTLVCATPYAAALKSSTAAMATRFISVLPGEAADALNTGGWLFSPEGDDWIDACGTPGRQPGGNAPDREHGDGGAAEHTRIAGGDLEELRVQE